MQDSRERERESIYQQSRALRDVRAHLPVRRALHGCNTYHRLDRRLPLLSPLLRAGRGRAPERTGGRGWRNGRLAARTNDENRTRKSPFVSRSSAHHTKIGPRAALIHAIPSTSTPSSYSVRSSFTCANVIVVVSVSVGSIAAFDARQCTRRDDAPDDTLRSEPSDDHLLIEQRRRKNVLAAADAPFHFMLPPPPRSHWLEARAAIAQTPVAERPPDEWRTHTKEAAV